MNSVTACCNSTLCWIKRCLGPPDFRVADHYKSQEEWAASFEVDPDEDFEDLLPYAERRYEEFRSLYSEHDVKASKVFAIGLSLVILLMAGIAAGHLYLWWSVPSIVCLLLAMLLALRVTIPGLSATPFTIRRCMKLLTDSKPLAVYILKSTHCAAEGLRVVIRWKAKMNTLATLLIILGLALALLPLIFSSDIERLG